MMKCGVLKKDRARFDASTEDWLWTSPWNVLVSMQPQQTRVTNNGNQRENRANWKSAFDQCSV